MHKYIRDVVMADLVPGVHQTCTHARSSSPSTTVSYDILGNLYIKLGGK